LPQICFTGFTNSVNEKLSHLAREIGYEVKQPVTKQLAILVIGDNAGPTKMEKAKAQGCTIFTEIEFMDHCRSKSNG
jgi:BRCT domain type II-containing protein